MRRVAWAVTNTVEGVTPSTAQQWNNALPAICAKGKSAKLLWASEGESVPLACTKGMRRAYRWRPGSSSLFRVVYTFRNGEVVILKWGFKSHGDNDTFYNDIPQLIQQLEAASS